LPLAVITFFLAIVATLCAIAGWFVALVTGRAPQFLRTILTIFLRVSLRLSAYTLLLTDRFPPFDFEEVPDDPVGLAVPPATTLNRAAVLFRLILVIPVYIVLYVASLGIFLIAFGAFVLSRPHFHRVERGGRKADAAVGFIGGILGGIGGYSGVLPTIWTQLRGWPRQIARGVYQPYIIVIQTISLVGIVLVTRDTTALVLLIEALPPLLVGTWIGWRIYGRMDERRFRQALAILLIASGAVLVL